MTMVTRPTPKLNGKGLLPQPGKVKQLANGRWQANYRTVTTGSPGQRVFDTEAQAVAFANDKFDEWVALGQVEYHAPSERAPRPKPTTGELQPDGNGHRPRKPWYDKKQGVWMALWRDVKTGKQRARTCANEAEAAELSNRMFDEWVTNGQPRPGTHPKKAKASKASEALVKTKTTEPAPVTTIAEGLPPLGTHVTVVGLFLDNNDDAKVMLRNGAATWLVAVEGRTQHA